MHDCLWMCSGCMWLCCGCVWLCMFVCGCVLVVGSCDWLYVGVLDFCATACVAEYGCVHGYMLLVYLVVCDYYVIAWLCVVVLVCVW